MKIGLVAGEMSGDILGSGLIRELKTFYPQAEFVGIGGNLMQTEGLQSLFPLERLSVMGFVEPLKRLPELLNIRKKLYRYFLQYKFDVVIGIDSPAFNGELEYKLKQKGVKTVHYVSPSVWAWRQGRIKKIARSVDLMLTLLPFELEIYRKHGVPAEFVGHPLADKFSLRNDNQIARLALKNLDIDCDVNQKTLVCLPGSRAGEVKLIGPVFWQALELVLTDNPTLQIFVPAANDQCYEQLNSQLSAQPNLPVKIVRGHSQELMAAADAVLLASGTTALEAMLLKKPMVVVYKMGKISYWIISSLLKVPYVSLPNLLVNRALVPELIQDQASAEAIAKEVQQQLNLGEEKQNLINVYTQLHQRLKMDADKVAARAIHKLLS